MENKTKITITLTKEAAKLIEMRGGEKYILECLKDEICSYNTPSCYELEKCGLYKQGEAVYEMLALHTKGNSWYEKLFPGVFNGK